MIGYRFFEKLFNDLDEKDQKRVLEHIFFIEPILAFSICSFDKKVIFRSYSESIFYQFVFIFDAEKRPIISMTGNRFVIYHIYPYYYKNISDEKCLNILFIKLLLSDDFDEVYQLFQNFL